MSRRILVTLASGLCLAGPLHAQGTADLRYAAPQPVRVSYSSVDSLSVVMSGLPVAGGDMTGTLQSVMDVEIALKDAKLSATGTIRQFTGTMRTGMGDVPMPAPEGGDSVVVVPLTPRGPDISDFDGVIPGIDLEGMAGEAMARGRIAQILLLLPGRPLARGETWTDTVTVRPEGQGLKAEGITIMKGTYARDTTVDGRALNVLQIHASTQMKAAGNMQGMDVNQTMTGVATSAVLWDPARRIVVSVDTHNDMNMSTAMQGMTIDMAFKTTSRTREIMP